MQGGDGFVVLQDPTDSRIVYSESQDGNMVRVDRVTGETMIDPAAAGDRASRRYRWHWDTPLMLSPHDPKVDLRGGQQGVPIDRSRAVVGRPSAPT